MPRPCLSLQRVSRIWDRGEHNAFTDICVFQNSFWLVFREGDTHVSKAGIIVVLRSMDAAEWQLAAELAMDDVDLRDPKIVVTPQQELLITCAGVMHKQSNVHQSFLFFSRDGIDWRAAQPVGKPRYWIWRTRFIDNYGYGVAYCRAEESTILYRLQDDEYHSWVDPLFSKASHGLGYPNEHDLFSIDDELMGCLLRRDADSASAQLGIASAPYRQWQWHDLGERIGGPVVMPMTQGNERYFLCALRLYDPVRTSLCWLDVEQHCLEEVLTLPSGGDTSYAGLVQHGERIYCSYYSSHEDKSAIYLAEINCPSDG